MVIESKSLTVIEIRIRFLRDLKGLTQKNLAKSLNVSQALINSWENGYQNISLRQLVKLSYFYQVPIDYIIGLTTEYDKSIYNFFPHFIRVSIKYNQNEFKYNKSSKEVRKISYSNMELTNVQIGIIKLVEDSPNITQDEMAKLLGVTARTIRNHIKHLVENEYIKRIGADKNGKWIVINKGSENND